MLEFSHKHTIYLHIYNLKDVILETICWTKGLELVSYFLCKILSQQELILKLHLNPFLHVQFRYFTLFIHILDLHQSWPTLKLLRLKPHTVPYILPENERYSEDPSTGQPCCLRLSVSSQSCPGRAEPDWPLLSPFLPSDQPWSPGFRNCRPGQPAKSFPSPSLHNAVRTY